MNVLHVTPAFYPATFWGGPIFAVYGLCNALANIAGVTVRVLTSDSAGPRLSDRVVVHQIPMHFAEGYDVYFTKRMWGREISPGLIKRLPSMVRWADVVHLTGTYSFPVVPTLFLCRLLGKPVVWSPRGALQRWAGTSRPWAKRQWERVCNALLVKGRAALHVTSEDEALSSASRIPRAEIVRIPNGIDIPIPSAERNWRPCGRLRLLYLGRLDPIKGIENLLAALSQLSIIDAQLVICGRGAKKYEAKLRNLVDELALADKVRFGGQVEGTDKSRAFWEADICVVPSFSENFGMVVAEALAHGVPVIASRGSPWAELESRGCGLWVDNSPESLRSAIVRMNERDLCEMGAKGRTWTEREFSWIEMAMRMETIYRRLAL